MTIHVPLVPKLKPLCAEAVDDCGCPVEGIVLLGNFVANAVFLSTA